MLTRSGIFGRAGLALLPLNSRTAYFGNSIAAAMHSASGIIYSNLIDGFGTWANANAQGTLLVPLDGYLGISGNYTAEMLARVGNVLAASPLGVVGGGGTNDRRDYQKHYAPRCGGGLGN